MIRERGRRLERQREGIATAKAEGRYKGRAPHDCTTRRRPCGLKALSADGLKPEVIAKRLGISRSSSYAILKGAREVA
jgi:DNA invertase Pin-like site-specific DNA recombinase